ncbi:MAG: hypothetical protein ACD_18C00291G0006 [uncultured bacterium]|nr:MAG: hypothetical protein ACD_18C00291G0006 [uncultured bacterium]OGH84765.1 MAG: hypothetical protein A2488_03465 [Candidatus Magasanikbacteria bacterium RIFOXYC12_FULL_32_21b]OGH88579.1 MAG: hypothetical protein A2507_02940 [Candidatus Magasanikbacteria bacterium RIFOXYD12_FULL_33_17]HAO52190.1 hypothetical protein [Candidatus Magasanikbacteria bacterium]
MKKIISFISQEKLKEDESILIKDIQPGIVKIIKKYFPKIKSSHHISLTELNKYRRLYFLFLVNEEAGEYDKIEKDVVDAISHNKILSENIEDEIDDKLTIGQKVADHVASFGGSWGFIITFFSFMALWMILNIIFLKNSGYDPYPFILLNLVLSCLAAIQAPIIMMSQNRQEQKDRQRSEHDYKVNLKAELEIKILNEKIDHLIVNQNKRMMEIQQVQNDYLEELVEGLNSKNRKK